MRKSESVSIEAQLMPRDGDSNMLRHMEMDRADELVCRVDSTFFVRHVAQSRQDLCVPRAAIGEGRAPVLRQVSWPARAILDFGRRAPTPYGVLTARGALKSRSAHRRDRNRLARHAAREEADTGQLRPPQPTQPTPWSPPSIARCNGRPFSSRTAPLKGTERHGTAPE